MGIGVAASRTLPSCFARCTNWAWGRYNLGTVGAGEGLGEKPEETMRGSVGVMVSPCRMSQGEVGIFAFEVSLALSVPYSVVEV